MSEPDWTVDTLAAYFASKVVMLQEALRDQDLINKERFASREYAIKIAQDATREALASREEAVKVAQNVAKEASDKLAGIYDMRHTQVETTVKEAVLRFMPKDIYEVQHTNLVKQVETDTARIYDLEKFVSNVRELVKQVSINTQRLYDTEKFIASIQNIKQEKREGINTIYYMIAIGGVLFTAIISVAALAFTILNYTSHIGG
jgi:hypothetical protein